MNRRCPQISSPQGRVLLLLGWLLCSGTSLLAADWSLEEVSIGYQGLFKVGCWTRLTLRISGPRETSFRPVITVADPDGAPVDELWPELLVPQEGAVEVSSWVRLGRLGTPIRIQVEAGNQRINLRTLPTDGTASEAGGGVIRSLPQHHQLWLLVGDHPAFQHAKARWNSAVTNSLEIVQTQDLRMINPPLSEGLNAIVLNPAVTISELEASTLANWVHRGGRLVIPVGGAVDELLLSPLARWLPILPVEAGFTRNLVPLRELVPKSASLKVVAELPAARFPEGKGIFLAGQLVVRGSYGLGQVTLLAVPLEREPLSTWDAASQAELAVKLLGIDPPWDQVTLISNRETDELLNPTGISDFQSQLVNVLERFPGVGRGSNWTVLGALLSLLLVVGPLDYLLVHRLLQRPHWTWLSFPLLSLGFAGILMSISTAGNQQPLSAQQIEVVDLDPQRGVLRSHSWFSFYSPESRRYELTAAPQSGKLPEEVELTQSPRLGWIERPEPGFRGMYHGGGLDRSKPRYSASPLRDSLLSYPVQIWSSGAAECDWEATGSQLQQLVEAQLSDQGDGRLRGAVTHHLGQDLRDWFIAYRTDAYLGSELQPLTSGQSFQVTGTRSANLEFVLLGEIETRTVEPGQYLPRITPWRNYDPRTENPDVILRVMSFHELLGGRKYSGLQHASTPEVDCSQLPPLNVAVLVGRLEQPLTEYRLDGTAPALSGSAVYVRLLLPVERRQRSGDAPPPQDLLRVP